ncbi:MAG: hypothetical protein VXX85_05960 [Candidatus Margulisiibacteriota bacterium]|nr:hypothetical protein [Candidatus Margulisiibacteriota bacterium]
MLILQCNDLYFKWLETVLISLYSFGNRFPMFISIYKGTSEMRDRCHEIYPNCIVELDCDNRYELPVDQHKVSDCMAVRKGYVLSYVCDFYNPEWVLMLDVDVLCRKNLNDLIQSFLLNQHKIVVINSNINTNYTDDFFAVEDTNIYRFFNSSFVFLNRDVFHFAHQWDFLMRHLDFSIGFEPMIWFWDQICLYFAIGTYYGEEPIHMIPRRLVLDESFGEDSYLWASTGGDKDLVYDFFVKYSSTMDVDLADAERFMNCFFERAMHWGAFQFASHIVNRDPSHKRALFMLALIYFEKLKNYDLAKKMFQALKDVQYNVNECNIYLNKIDELTN